MKCPNCGFNSFDYLDECKKCKLPLNPSKEYKSIYKRLRNNNEPKPKDSFRTTQHSDENKERNASEHDYVLDSDQDIPVYHKRQGYKDQTPSDITRAGHTDVDERHIGVKDLSTERAFKATTEEYSEDPILYSESQEAERATNLAEASESHMENEESYSIAGLRLRAVAFSIDIILVGIITYITIEPGFYFLGGEGIKPEELSRVFFPIFVLLFFLASTYFIFLHYYAGRTVGKMLLGIRVISADGKQVGLWESFMRWVGYYISAVFLFAGFMWSIFDPDSQAWHDKIAGTYVVIG